MLAHLKWEDKQFIAMYAAPLLHSFNCCNSVFSELLLLNCVFSQTERCFTWGQTETGGCFLIYVSSFNVFAAKWTLYCLGSGWWCIMMKSWWSLEERLRPRHLILRLITPINWSPLLWFYSAGQLRHMFDKIGEISGFSSKTNISEGHLWKCLFW